MSNHDHTIEDAIINAIAAMRHLAGEIEVEMSEHDQIPEGLDEVWQDLMASCDHLDAVAEAQGIDLEAFDFSDPDHPRRLDDIDHQGGIELDNATLRDQLGADPALFEDDDDSTEPGRVRWEYERDLDLSWLTDEDDPEDFATMCAVAERQCARCGEWHVVDSLGNVTFMVANQYREGIFTEDQLTAEHLPEQYQREVSRELLGSKR